MNINICRPFTLYNDFIPPVSEDHSDWRYISFGYYDGFERGENLFAEGKYNLQHMWEYYLKQSESLNGSYLSQILYGLREETPEEEIITDNEFWDKDNIEKEYPFVFLSLIQISENENGQKEFRAGWERRREFEKKVNTGNEYKVIVYMSFDSSDMIMVVRSKNYMSGAKLIDKFHDKKDQNILQTTFGWELKYSFTVASFNKSAIEEKSFIDIDENISKVVVYLIERYPGGVDDYIEYIQKWGREKGVEKERIDAFIDSRHAILGCNDEVFEISDTSWRKLLELYKEREGIFNSTNPKYRTYLNGITTIIGIKKQVESDEKK